MNVFKEIGIGLADVGKWFANAVKAVLGIATKVKRVLTAANQLEPQFVEGLSTVVNDVELLISDAEGAVSASGLNFAADSAAYQQFLKLVHDFKTLAPIVEEAIQILEGKTPPSNPTSQG